MQTDRKRLLLAIASMVAGLLAFFLFLFAAGHDPDERPLTIFEWMLAGALIAPGFAYLLKWRNAKDGRR